MKATVNKETCVGCGLCVDMCPEVFEMNEENVTVAKVQGVPTDAEAACGHYLIKET